MSAPSLEKRIAAVLTDDVASSAVAALLQETEAAIAAADQAAEEARAKALDPLASLDAAKARAAMENAAFTRDRLRTVVPRLRARYAEVRAQEAYDRWVMEYENVKPRRDAAAEELKAIYPEFVAKITDLLFSIEDTDREVRRVNGAKPFDAEAANGNGRWLREVELEARDIAGFGNGLSIMKDLRLPAWEPSADPVWPPHRQRGLDHDQAQRSVQCAQATGSRRPAEHCGRRGAPAGFRSPLGARWRVTYAGLEICCRAAS